MLDTRLLATHPIEMVTAALTWKMGFEIELIAPPRRSRLDLAQLTADRLGGTVESFFHPQSEPSQAKGVKSFMNLTPGFRVRGPDGEALVSFVDDITLQRDLDRRAAAVPGWYRIVADDARLLRLVIRHCDPDAALETVLEPLAGLFGTEQQPREGDMIRIVDDAGASVALGAPLPGERQRPCEIVTAPIQSGHAEILEGLLANARELDFAVPHEGATHIHYDAENLNSAPVIASMVAMFSRFGADLKALVGVNPNCVRLGAWPAALLELTQREEFQAMEWDEARAALLDLSLTKYCDFNLLNIVTENLEKHTFEVRVLPSTLDAEPVLEAAALFEALLVWCCRPPATRPPLAATLAEQIGQTPPFRS